MEKNTNFEVGDSNGTVVETLNKSQLEVETTKLVDYTDSFDAEITSIDKYANVPASVAATEDWEEFNELLKILHLNWDTNNFLDMFQTVAKLLNWKMKLLRIPKGYYSVPSDWAKIFTEKTKEIIFKDVEINRNGITEVSKLYERMNISDKHQEASAPDPTLPKATVDVLSSSFTTKVQEHKTFTANSDIKLYDDEDDDDSSLNNDELNKKIKKPPVPIFASTPVCKPVIPSTSRRPEGVSAGRSRPFLAPPLRPKASIKQEFTRSSSTKQFSPSVRNSETVSKSVKHYACNTCRRAFAQPGNLQIHVKSKHMGIRYPCLQCGNTFANRGTLLTHQEKYHSSLLVDATTTYNESNQPQENTLI